MKRALPFLLVPVVTASIFFVVFSILSTESWERAGHEPWPDGLGTLEDVAARFPKAEPSAAALRLTELARPLGIDFTWEESAPDAMPGSLAGFVEGERKRDVVAIGAPPADVAAYLAKHAAAIDAIREHLLGHPDIVWEVDVGKRYSAPVPKLPAYLQLTRVFVARALLRARSGDAGAWEDLRAVAVLDRTLQLRPEFMSQLVAVSYAQAINAAAWKLPLPAPPWLAGLHAQDRRRLLLRGMQYEVWKLWQEASQSSPRSVWRPYVRAAVASAVRHQRETAIEVSRMTACAVDGEELARRRLNALPWWNVTGRLATFAVGIARLRRYDAEREATANALRIRAGEPIVAGSRCSDGSWRYENGRLSFSRPVPSETPAVMPLVLSVQFVPHDAPAGDDQLHVDR